MLRTGGTASAIGCVVKAPSTLGTFLRSFRWGHVRQLVRVSRELLARGLVGWGRTRRRAVSPGLHHLRDLRSGQGGRRDHGYTGGEAITRCWPLGAGTGDVADGSAAQGPRQHRSGRPHFLRETVGRVRYAGARGQLTVRADSGFYTHAIVAVCRKMDVRYSITVRQHARLRNIIEAIPETDWTPIPYWWTAPPTWRRPSTSPSRMSPTPHRCGSSSGG